MGRTPSGALIPQLKISSGSPSLARTTTQDTQTRPEVFFYFFLILYTNPLQAGFLLPAQAAVLSGEDAAESIGLQGNLS